MGLLFIGLSVQMYAKDTIVVLETNVGKIEIKMYPKASPLAVENFVTHVRNGYYNGLIFHRVIKGFMIQGGDPICVDPKCQGVRTRECACGTGGESIWKKDFDNENTPNLVFDKPFLIAMANHGPNTNGSQFFITTAAKSHLNGGYTIFGEVIKGQKSVQKIENVSTGAADKPIYNQVIKKAYIKK